MMKKIQLVTTFIFAALLVGCSTSTSEELKLTEEFEAVVATAIAETNTASLQLATETAEPQLITPESTENAVQPSLLPTTTPSLQPTQTSVAVDSTATPLPTPCYRAELVEETIPDGTVIEAGRWFAKTWVIRNTGVCEWTEDFRWVLVEGTDFSAATDLALNQDVQPGEEIKILMELKAPTIAGHFKGTYQIFTEDGGSVTPSGFWVLIKVE